MSALALLSLLAVAPRLPAVRSLVRVELEQLLAVTCRGKVELDRIAELSLGGVLVEGVTVRDPEGRSVLRAPRLALGLDPLALLHGELRFTHGLLEEARIRAIESESMAITLFDALSPPDEPPPDSAEPSGGLDVAFEHIHVTHARLYGSVPGLHELEAVGLEARGSIRILAGELEVRVTTVRADLVRPYPHALALDRGTFTLDTSPLRMQAKARVSVGNDRVHVALTYRKPDAGDDRLDLLLALEPVSPERLEDIGIAAAQILLSDLRGHARLFGPLRELAFRAALQTDAGSITFEGKLPEAGGANLRIASPALELEHLLAYAPPLRLGASIEVAAAASGEVALRLRAPVLSLYGVELTEADIAGRYARERLTFESARLRFGGGRFDVSGWVDAAADLSLRIRSRLPDLSRDPVVRQTGLHGAVRTDLRIDKRDDDLAIEGSLGIEQFGFANVTAKEIVLEGSASAKEDLSELRLDVSGASWGTAWHGFAIGDISFRARGKAPRYGADFELLDFHGRSAKAHVELTDQRRGYHVVLWPFELGVPGREPWRAKADLTIADDGLTFHQVFLANGPQRLDLSGAYSYTKDYRVDATLQSFDLGGLRELSGVDLADLEGTVDGKLALTGIPGHPRIDAQGALRSGVFLGMRDLSLTLSLASLERRFDVDAEIVLPDKSRLALYAGGEPGGGDDWMTQISAGNYQFGLDFERVPFEVGRPWLGWLGLTPPPGTISATVRGAGTLAAPLLNVTSQVEGLKLGEWPALDIGLDAEHDGQRATVRSLSIADERGPIAHLQGFVEARSDELLSPLELRTSLGTRPLELDLTWENRRLDELPKPLRVNLPMPSSGRLHVAQTSRGPSLELSTRLGWPEQSEGLDACGAYRHPELVLSVSSHERRSTAKLTASLDGEQLAMADIEAGTPVVPWLTGTEPLSLPRTSFTLNAATQAAEEVPWLCEVIAGPLRVDVSALDAFADPPELTFSLRSNGLQLVAHESQRQRLGALRDARTVGRPFALAGRGGVEGPSFTFRGTIEQDHKDTLRIDAAFPRAALRSNAGEKSGWPLARVTLDAQQLELAALLLALPGGVRGSGLLSGRADVRYDFAKDTFSLAGALSLNRGKLGISSLGQDLSDVSGRIRLHDNVILLEGLKARDFDGRIGAAGELTLASSRELHSELALSLTDFPIRRESAPVSKLTGSMRLRATTTPERTRAELTFGDLRVNLPNDLGQGLQALDQHSDIFVRGVETEAPDEAPHTLELRVVAQKPPFRILRSDLSAEVAADLTIRYRAPSVTLQGAAEIKRGEFELYGKRFELGESRLAFDGSEDIDPLVSISAVHHSGSDDIGVRVDGRLSAPTISFSHSNAAITQPGDIIAQLLGARSTDPARQSQDATGAAAAIIAGATAGLLTREVRQELGGALPVLSLESSSQTLRSTRIRAGVQLDQLIERRLGPLRQIVRGAYVEGFVAPGAPGEEANTTTAPQSRGGGLLELRFPKDLVGTIEYRPVQNWRLDVAWEP